ncbi:helix-turn-helix domain-containing protein [Gracilibacillus kekensis]|nr:helix-turn-helix transcriptional regulator [Gracilibacillus kekensis]
MQEQDPKWTQHYVGAEAGLDPEHYSKIERGKYPHISFITVEELRRC